MPALTKAERDALLSKARTLNSKLYPDDDSEAPHGRAASLIRESYYQVLGEYADRLPRIALSACPFTGEAFKHSFDSWGIDGPWWQESREVEIEEPAPPSTFKVLLGALAFHGRTPSESRAQVIPGPEVPFVVPRLLKLPEMVAVVSQVDLETGDTAYPIVYYSREAIPPQKLHQFWLEQDFWFELEGGKSGWLIANDEWDFDLHPWIAAGKLRWIRPGDPKMQVFNGENGEPCPYLNLPGERYPQSIAFGERNLMELPDGTPVDPYPD